MTQPLEIDVISDVMCPWCYIGKRRLEAALAQRPDVQTDIRWRPFQLDPTIPREGMDRQEYLDRKFGRERATSFYQTIKDAGNAEGIHFEFERIEKSPNTLDAHRVIRWSASGGVQDGVVESLFNAYFVEGADLTDKVVLRDAAVSAGMDGELVERLLQGDADEDLVTREIGLAQQMGVQGVPCFILANKYVVMGAQDPSILVQAIDQALADNDSPSAEGA